MKGERRKKKIFFIKKDLKKMREKKVLEKVL